MLYVEKQIKRAAFRSGRDPVSVKLVAVTKTVPPELIREALAAGVSALGESRVQEMLVKQPLLPENIEWHFIGHLQRNKVKSIINKVQLIHSLDSWRLAEEIDRRAEENKKVDVLVQVNVAGEPTKHGLAPAEVVDFIRELSVLKGLKVRGLMTIAPEVDNVEEVRPVFRELYLLSKRIREVLPAVAMDYLSMGMTSDYTVAVEEGANIVRLGSAIFGHRKSRRGGRM